MMYCVFWGGVLDNQGSIAIVVQGLAGKAAVRVMGEDLDLAVAVPLLEGAVLLAVDVLDLLLQ